MHGNQPMCAPNFLGVCKNGDAARLEAESTYWKIEIFTGVQAFSMRLLLLRPLQAGTRRLGLVCKCLSPLLVLQERAG